LERRRQVGKPKGGWIDAADGDEKRMLKCKKQRKQVEDRDVWRRKIEKTQGPGWAVAPYEKEKEEGKEKKILSPSLPFLISPPGSETLPKPPYLHKPAVSNYTDAINRIYNCFPQKQFILLPFSVVLTVSCSTFPVF
jgi:hypothetical protein